MNPFKLMLVFIVFAIGSTGVLAKTNEVNKCSGATSFDAAKNVLETIPKSKVKKAIIKHYTEMRGLPYKKAEKLAKVATKKVPFPKNHIAAAVIANSVKPGLSKRLHNKCIEEYYQKHK